MEVIIGLLKEHYMVIGGGFLYVAVAMVSALPNPDLGEKFQFYPWFYHVLNLLLNKVPAKYQPKEQAVEKAKAAGVGGGVSN